MAALETNRALSGNFLRYTNNSPPIRSSGRRHCVPSRFGTCMESCTCALLAMRSKGIPVAIDFTPQWANRKYGHYWLTVLNMRHRSEQFAPFDIEPDAPPQPSLLEDLPHDLPPESRTGRTAFPQRDDSLVASIHLFFGMSATNTCAPTISTSPLFDDIDIGDNIYISTFNNQEWVAVACGERRRGSTAHFRKTGSERLLYARAIRPKRVSSDRSPLLSRLSGQDESFSSRYDGLPNDPAHTQIPRL